MVCLIFSNSKGDSEITFNENLTSNSFFNFSKSYSLILLTFDSTSVAVLHSVFKSF